MEKNQVLSSFMEARNENEPGNHFQRVLEGRRSGFMFGFIPPAAESHLLISPKGRDRKRGRNRRKRKRCGSRKKTNLVGESERACNKESQFITANPLDLGRFSTNYSENAGNSHTRKDVFQSRPHCECGNSNLAIFEEIEEKKRRRKLEKKWVAGGTSSAATTEKKWGSEFGVWSSEMEFDVLSGYVYCEILAKQSQEKRNSPKEMTARILEKNSPILNVVRKGKGAFVTPGPLLNVVRKGNGAFITPGPLVHTGGSDLSTLRNFGGKSGHTKRRGAHQNSGKFDNGCYVLRQLVSRQVVKPDRSLELINESNTGAGKQRGDLTPCIPVGLRAANNGGEMHRPFKRRMQIQEELEKPAKRNINRQRLQNGRWCKKPLRGAEPTPVGHNRGKINQLEVRHKIKLRSRGECSKLLLLGNRANLTHIFQESIRTENDQLVQHWNPQLLGKPAVKEQGGGS